MLLLEVTKVINLTSGEISNIGLSLLETGRELDVIMGD